MYYALWYIFKDGERTTNAISVYPLSLENLHEKILLDYDNLYYTYINSINKIVVEPIDCYQYNEELKTLEHVKDYNELNNGLFYATQYFCHSTSKTLILTEILVYLTKEQHEIWRDCSQNKKDKDKKYPYFFYENFISLNNIKVDVYYDDGIMNA
jgi:hypothetical protein